MFRKMADRSMQRKDAMLCAKLASQLTDRLVKGTEEK